MINSKEAAHIADLSRLSFSEQELTVYSKQLDQILNYINQLNELDLSALEPFVHASEQTNIFRPDVPTESQRFADASHLINAAEKRGTLIVVPKILEGNE